MSSWEEWAQDASKSLLQGVIDYKVKQPYDLQRLRIESKTPDGETYEEGQPTRMVSTGGLQLSSGMLLLGGVVLVFVLLRD